MQGWVDLGGGYIQDSLPERKSPTLEKTGIAVTRIRTHDGKSRVRQPNHYTTEPQRFIQCDYDKSSYKKPFLHTYCHRQRDQQNNHLVDLWTYLAIPTNKRTFKYSKILNYIYKHH